MTGELSPEEKLLNLIREKPQTSSPAPAIQPSPLTPDKEKPAIPKAKKTPLRMPGRKKLPAILRKCRPVNPGFKLTHKVLSGLVFLLLAYLAFDYIDTPKTPEELSIAKVVVRKEEPLLAQRPYSYYSGEIGKRDIFRPYTKPKPKLPPPPALKRVTLRELAAGLTLTGIILDRNPQVVIIDNKEKKTYFLNKGQFLKEIKIEDIIKGKVILSYQGERLDLRL